ncbi:MAG: aldehyde dehydrogenase family protein [Myxococcota bacterium]
MAYETSAVSTPIASTTSPADGSPLPLVNPSSSAEISAVLAAARAAQPAWGQRSLADRSEALRALTKAILGRRSELIDLLAKETGRSPAECALNELAGLSDVTKNAIKTAHQALAPEAIKLSPLDYPGKSATIEAVPRGVVAIIAPWNYPFGNFLKSLFPALLAGNAVVLKPSEHTPRTGGWLAEIASTVLPSGLVGLVQGAGDVGAQLLDGAIDAVVFTGSVPSGKRVAMKAAERLIPCSVELGGKDAAIVLADCDLDRTAIGIAQWGIHNAGQNCAGIERVYVEASIADAFVAKLGKVVSKLRVAPQSGPSDLGPVQNARQLEIVERHVEEARTKGATIVCGGKRTGQGLGYEPTVIDRATEELLVMREETFGPVIAVARVKDAEEAIRRANDSIYGLNGSVWTKDIARGEAIARRLEVGVALVNNHAITGTMAQLPWTGVKDTGPGVAQSRHAYSTFVRRRTVFVDRSKNPDPWWFPINEDSAAFAEALIERGLGSLGAVFRLAGLLGKRMKAIKALVN